MDRNADLPEWVVIISKVEIFEPGNKLKLYYRNDTDAIYKLPGAFFGLSPNQIRTAIKNGKAKPI